MRSAVVAFVWNSCAVTAVSHGVDPQYLLPSASGGRLRLETWPLPADSDELPEVLGLLTTHAPWPPGSDGISDRYRSASTFTEDPAKDGICGNDLHRSRHVAIANEAACGSRFPDFKFRLQANGDALV